MINLLPIILIHFSIYPSILIYIYFFLNICMHYQQYSYNRRGNCDIRINVIPNSIQHLESTVVLRQISFNTYLTHQGVFSSFLQGNIFNMFYKFKDVFSDLKKIYHIYYNL